MQNNYRYCVTNTFKVEGIESDQQIRGGNDTLEEAQEAAESKTVDYADYWHFIIWGPNGEIVAEYAKNWPQVRYYQKIKN